MGRSYHAYFNPVLADYEQVAKEEAERPSDAAACSPSWRSSAFWHSDIEDVMERIANEAMGYHPDSRDDFFRDVANAINEHLENTQDQPLQSTASQVKQKDQ